MAIFLFYTLFLSPKNKKGKNIKHPCLPAVLQNPPPNPPKKKPKKVIYDLKLILKTFFFFEKFWDFGGKPYF